MIGAEFLKIRIIKDPYLRKHNKNLLQLCTYYSSFFDLNIIT